MITGGRREAGYAETMGRVFVNLGRCYSRATRDATTAPGEGTTTNMFRRKAPGHLPIAGPISQLGLCWRVQFAPSGGSENDRNDEVEGAIPATHGPLPFLPPSCPLPAASFGRRGYLPALSMHTATLDSHGVYGVGRVVRQDKNICSFDTSRDCGTRWGREVARTSAANTVLKQRSHFAGADISGFPARVEQSRSAESKLRRSLNL